MAEQESIASGQYLSFTLREESFSVEIAKVREVLDVTTLTRIPRMPGYLAGVINLRSNVVPVVDLGVVLGMAPIDKTVNTCIMIVDIHVLGEEAAIQMGVLTDSVQAVLDLSEEDIESVPKMGTNLNTDFIKGMGRMDDKFLILLDIDRVLASEGEAVLREMGPSLLADNSVAAAGGMAS